MKRIGVLLLAFLLAALTFSTTGHAVQAAGTTYSYGSDPLQTVAVTKAKGAPLLGGRWVMVIHGGAWVGSDATNLQSAVDVLTAGGYTVFNINYRLAAKDTWPEQWADVASAWSWIRSHALQFGIDPNRGATWGSSTGGQLAAMAGNRLPGVRAVVSVVGVLQPYRLAQDVLNGHRMSYPEFDVYTDAAIALRLPYAPFYPPANKAWHSFYPQHYLSTGSAPTIMFQGSADDILPKATAPSYANLLARYHVPSKIVTAKGVSHSLTTALDGGARQKAMFAWLNKYTVAQ